MSTLPVRKMPNLGFGNMRMPMKNGEVDTELIFRMVDTYMAHGYNYFDTAHTYKGSEDMLRKALVERYPRESYTITTKVNLGVCSCAEDMRHQFDTSLKRLGIDYVDIYFIHGLGAMTYEKAEKFKAFDFLRSLRDSGLARHIGFSFHGTADKLDELLTANPDMELVQLQINYLDWEDPKVQSRLCYEVARKHGVPVSVMEPAKGGWLAGNEAEASKMMLEYNPNASVASWAFRFVAGLEGIYAILSGMGNVEQVEDNVHTFENFTPLTEEERAITLKAVDMINSVPRVPCTGCRYCTNNCPQNLPVPLFMNMYNSIVMFNTIEAIRYQYYHFAEPEKRAANCIGCRTCEEHCPQGIEITRYIKIVEETLD